MGVRGGKAARNFLGNKVISGTYLAIVGSVVRKNRELKNSEITQIVKLSIIICSFTFL